jgi:hypothetical protein
MGRGRQAAWWLMLVLGLLLAVFFWQVLGACGLALPGGRPILLFCPIATTAAARPDPLAAERARQGVIEDEIRRLELALLQRPVCAPGGAGGRPVPIGPAGTAETQPSGPDVPDVPTTPAAPEQQAERPPASEEAPPEVPAQQAEAIPEEKWDERDVSFLEGCWTLDASLAFRREGTEIVDRTTGWSMCFGADGRGTQKVSYSGGEECEVPIESRFLPDGQLEIDDAGPVDCSGPFTMYPQTRTCARVDAQEAICDWIGRRPDGSEGAGGRNSFRRAS